MKLSRFLSTVVVLMMIAASPASAQTVEELKIMIEDMRQEYEIKLQGMEKKLAELESSQSRRVSDEVARQVESQSLNLDYVGRGAAPVGSGGLMIGQAGGSNVSVGGYMDIEYHNGDDSESTFNQHHLNFGIAGQIHERVQFNSEFEVEYGGPDSAAGDGEIKVEYAYVDYLIHDSVNVRAGAVLAPFGRYNLYHDSPLVDLTDRPLLARDIVPTGWTEAGAGLFGEFNPVIGEYEDLLVNYEVYVVNGLDDGFSDTGFRGARNSLKTDNNDNKAIVGRMALSPVIGHEIGLSGYFGEYDSSHDLTGGALDMFNTFGPFELTSEYAYFDVEEDPTLTLDRPNWLQGAYTQLSYHFWPEFLSETFLGRGFDHPTFTLIGRYDWAKIKDDVDAGSGDNEEERYTIGLNYRPFDNFVWKIEYQFNSTENESLEGGDDDKVVSSIAVGF